MDALQCPLDPYVMLHLKTRMDFAHVKEIEHHVSNAICRIHPPLKHLLLQGTFDGSTPLLLACKEGHLDSVKHIIEVWGANVRAAASYYHRVGEEKSKIEGATPLFVAALNGRIDIVRYLIMKRANVSAITSTEGNPEYGGLTPLHGALMESRPGQSFHEKCAESKVIVRLLLFAGADPCTLASDGTPVWMRPFCGVDAITALVNNGLNLNQLSSSGKTIFNYWIYTSFDDFYEQDRLTVIEILLDNVWARRNHENSKIADIVNHLWGILEAILHLHPDGRFLSMITDQVVDKLLIALTGLRKGDPLYNVKTITKSLKLISAVDPDRCIPPSYDFLTMLAGLPNVLSHEDIRQHLSKLIWQDDGLLLVHATSGTCLDALRLLLHAGANPHESKSGENGPLHILANREEDLQTEFTAAHLLFVYGAQPLRINKEGETAVDIWMKANCNDEGIKSSAWNDRPDWCRDTIPKLECLSAKTINIHRISCDKLPTKLHSFVEKH